MADPYVRDIAEVEDFDGRPLRLGVDYDTVVVAGHRLSPDAITEFAAAFAGACRAAGENARKMRAEADAELLSRAGDAPSDD